jgi:hypothetical protein
MRKRNFKRSYDFFYDRCKVPKEGKVYSLAPPLPKEKLEVFIQETGVIGGKIFEIFERRMLKTSP